MAEGFRKLHWVPVAACVEIMLTFVVTYAVAVYLGHVEPGLPYISDTGTRPPESCIFGQFLNIGAILVAVTFYIRYKQVEEYIRDSGGQSMMRTNQAALVLGFLSALGMSMVANFQETSVLAVHLTGAVLAFGLGSVYAILHTVLSYQLSPHITSLSVCHFRAVLSALASAMFISMFTFFHLAAWFSPIDHAPGQNWYPYEKGFTLHVISAASEWVMALAMMLYFLSFYPEFKAVSMSTPDLSINLMHTESLSGLYTGAAETA